MKHAATGNRTLWNAIEARLDSRLPEWRMRIGEMRQLAAVQARTAGRIWSNDEVFEALAMAVLSAQTDWSKIERVQKDLRNLFSGFRLEWYAELSDAEIGALFPPWFKERRAGSMALEKNLVNLAGAARILSKYSRDRGTADGYFTSLVRDCGGDPKLAAIRLGRPGKDKLPTLGVPLAAEALKNLGFDVAKPDRHIMRAVGSFGLVTFGRWTQARDGRNRRSAPSPNSREQFLAMTAVQNVAETMDERVVVVDNAIWMLCARSGLYLTNSQLAEMARAGTSPEDRAEDLRGLFRSWMGIGSAEEQRDTIEHLIRALDENRLSDRELFPTELKGKSW